MRLSRQMLQNQARLLARSAGYLVRHPSAGREFPQLVAARTRSTMELRLPWLPFRLIEELDGLLSEGARVFEYGGGGSTLWFLDRGTSVVTVEHHAGWARALSELVRGSSAAEHWTLLQPSTDNSFDEYVDAILDYPDDSFDLVVVDGRERGRCAHAAMPKVRPGGLMLVDDVDRERYRAPLASIEWPRWDVVGFAPAKPSLAYTTVFRRPSARG